VSIALAEASGNTVLAARRTLQAARQALANALKQSHGKNTVEVNQARAQAIQAEASLRDAKLQDSLDTIDFNLQMGRMTQSSAIAALQQILKTQDLTKAQRRQLLLQIKGMKDEIANSQWNFGDISLPTPYQMRRYVQQQIAANSKGPGGTGGGRPVVSGFQQNTAAVLAAAQTAVGGTTNNNTTVNHIRIDGADTGKILKLLKDVLGTGGGNTTTIAARRNR
jgi:hypothetical protein